MTYEVVIGLEVHAQLKTSSKIFCSCSTEFGTAPNVNICPVCTGQPGVLPVLNKKAVEYLVKTAAALNCRISPHSIFARKQYFYPDLPKNYQISQYELPLAEKGWLDITTDSTAKRIGITRIHLEEDAGKLLHAIGSRELDYSLVDYNRTGVPLMEIVSEPDLSSPKEAYHYLSALKAILEYLDVSDANMEEGKFRCDANISIRPVGQKALGTKTELKNMNSFSGVQDALEFEIERQKEVLASGGRVVQETRLWDADAKASRSMRSKEEAHDYRYFPEPDLVPIELGTNYVEEIRRQLPELPEARRMRFIKKLGLPEYDAEVLSSDHMLADYYESALVEVPEAAKMLSNWVMTELLGRLNSSGKDISESSVSSKSMGKLVALIHRGTISGKIAKAVFEEMFAAGRSAEEIIKEKKLVQISDEETLAKICDEAIKESPKAVEEFKAGKERAIGALVGAVMKKSRGQANPGLVNKILKEKLSRS